MKSETIAIFDLDKTLIPFDCDEAWGRHMHAMGYTQPDFLTQQQRYFDQYDAGTLDIHAYQQFSLESTIQVGPLIARHELAKFVDTSVRPRLTGSVLQLIDSHRQQGHRLLVITATNAFVSRAVVSALGIGDLLAIDLEVDAQGWFNGKIQGTPSFQEGKVSRLQSWLAEQGLQRTDLNLFFYSDSINDLPLLAYADHPVATNPSAALRAHAQEKGWQILDLFVA